VKIAADKGKPPPKDFATVIISGSKSKFWYE
jgi:hypothetical protein